MAAVNRQPPVSPAPTLHSEHGFTLTELAVVMFIVALLIGGMMMPLSAQQEIRARQETEKTLNEIRDALLGFAIANKRLPRPATSATNGIENPTDCATEAACSGFIPWATLGTARSDGWGKLILYSVTPAFSKKDVVITLQSVATRTVKTRDKDGGEVFLAGSGTCTDKSLCVSAVFLSQGKTGYGTTDAGTTLANTSAGATNADEKLNNDGPTNYFSRLPGTSTPGGEFDDIVSWIPATTLIYRVAPAEQ